MGLTLGLLSIPLLIVNERTLLPAALGLVPFLFLNADYRRRYICVVTITAGFGGLVFLPVNYLDCGTGELSLLPPGFAATIHCHTLLLCLSYPWIVVVTINHQGRQFVEQSK